MPKIMTMITREIKAGILIAFLFIFGCHPVLTRDAEHPGQALVPVRWFYPQFADDMDYESLRQAVKRNLEYLARLDPDLLFVYGPHQFTCRQVRDTQETLLRLISDDPPPGELNRLIKQHFKVYRAAGRPGKKSVLFTGYYEPIYEGRLQPDEKFRYPIYKKPDDLIRIDLSIFNSKFKGESIVARIDGKKVIPYYSRQQIEIEQALGGRGLEIAWLKSPLDVAFLHIQGSGRISLPDGKELLVGYNATNGRAYRSIGRYMCENGLLSLESASMQGIREYLSEHPEVIDEVLNHNPSYIFFHCLAEGPLGNINVPLTPGRSIALDYRLFPKGALCFISTEKPLISGNRITGWTDFSRFVVNQDTGGAIKGAGRADLFWGNGPDAELAAGHMKQEGELYVLIKK